MRVASAVLTFAGRALAHVAARDERGFDALDLVVEPREVGVDAVAGVVEDLAEPPFVDAPERVHALQLQGLGGLLSLQALVIQVDDLIHQGQLGVLELLADVLLDDLRILPDKLNV